MARKKKSSSRPEYILGLWLITGLLAQPASAQFRWLDQVCPLEIDGESIGSGKLTYDAENRTYEVFLVARSIGCDQFSESPLPFELTPGTRGTARPRCEANVRPECDLSGPHTIFSLTFPEESMRFGSFDGVEPRLRLRSDAGRPEELVFQGSLTMIPDQVMLSASKTKPARVPLDLQTLSPVTLHYTGRVGEDWIPWRFEVSSPQLGPLQDLQVRIAGDPLEVQQDGRRISVEIPPQGEAGEVEVTLHSSLFPGPLPVKLVLPEPKAPWFRPEIQVSFSLTLSLTLAFYFRWRRRRKESEEGEPVLTDPRTIHPVSKTLELPIAGEHREDMEVTLEAKGFQVGDVLDFVFQVRSKTRLNLVCMLDVSASMKPEDDGPIRFARDFVLALEKARNPRDLLALGSFGVEGTAKVLLEPTTRTTESYAHVEKALFKLDLGQPESCLAPALHGGIELLRKNSLVTSADLLIVISDGEFRDQGSPVVERLLRDLQAEHRIVLGLNARTWDREPFLESLGDFVGLPRYELSAVGAASLAKSLVGTLRLRFECDAEVQFEGGTSLDVDWLASSRLVDREQILLSDLTPGTSQRLRLRVSPGRLGRGRHALGRVRASYRSRFQGHHKLARNRGWNLWVEVEDGKRTKPSDAMAETLLLESTLQIQRALDQYLRGAIQDVWKRWAGLTNDLRRLADSYRGPWRSQLQRRIEELVRARKAIENEQDEKALRFKIHAWQAEILERLRTGRFESSAEEPFLPPEPDEPEVSGVGDRWAQAVGEANVSGATVSGPNVSGANVSGANASGANISGTNISGANVSGANASGPMPQNSSGR